MAVTLQILDSRDKSVIAVRPLSARSIVLSLLLGAHPAELSHRVLARLAEEFAVSEPTLRVALSRMVAAGDVIRTARGYGLAARLLERQARQDAELAVPPARAWDGDWELAVITGTGRAAGARAALRAELVRLRLGELREGVWMRPANLARGWPADVERAVRHLSATGIDDGPALAAELWPLAEWARTAQALAGAFHAAPDPRERLTYAAAIVRHLRSDPHLPPELTPRGWPAPALREDYAAYQAELARLVTPEPARPVTGAPVS
jgi:phenylacetic acid degradation operon negative regulatory protein